MVVAKKKVGFWLDEEIAEKLDVLAGRFDGLKGEVVAAALSMYIGADRGAQAEALKRVLGEKVDRAFGPEKLSGGPGAKKAAKERG